MQCQTDFGMVFNGELKTPLDEFAMRPSPYAFTNLIFSNIKLTFILKITTPQPLPGHITSFPCFKPQKTFFQKLRTKVKILMFPKIL